MLTVLVDYFPIKECRETRFLRHFSAVHVPYPGLFPVKEDLCREIHEKEGSDRILKRNLPVPGMAAVLTASCLSATVQAQRMSMFTIIMVI